MLLIKLDIVQSEVLRSLQGLFRVELSKAITLDAHDELAERVGFLLVCPEGRGPGKSQGRGGAGLQKAPPSNGISFSYLHRCLPPAKSCLGMQVMVWD